MIDISGAGPALPPLHNAWLGVLTGVQDPPSEPKATCGDCVMCADVERSGSRVTFSPDVKCCSYIPHIANFIAGRALAGPGSDSIRQRIARRTGVTPLGLGLSHADVRHLVGARAHFGRDPVVRCPHFVTETQGCAIWQSRNAVCSTWFCKHERGQVSQQFWHAVRDLLIAAEERIAYRCLSGSGLPEAQVAAVLEHRSAVRETIRRANDTLDGPDGADPLPADPLPADPLPDDVSEAWYARMWGDWQGREDEWFGRCAGLVAELADDDLSSWMDGVKHLIDTVQLSWARLQEASLPERLRFAPGTGSEAGTEVLRLIGYSPFDPLVAPASLLPAMRRFDGRPTAEVLAEIDRAPGLELTPDLLGRLLDSGVMIGPE